MPGIPYSRYYPVLRPQLSSSKDKQLIKLIKIASSIVHLNDLKTYNIASGFLVAGDCINTFLV